MSCSAFATKRRTPTSTRSTSRRVFTLATSLQTGCRWRRAALPALAVRSQIGRRRRSQRRQRPAGAGTAAEPQGIGPRFHIKLPGGKWIRPGIGYEPGLYGVMGNRKVSRPANRHSDPVLARAAFASSPAAVCQREPTNGLEERGFDTLEGMSVGQYLASALVSIVVSASTVVVMHQYVTPKAAGGHRRSAAGIRTDCRAGAGDYRTARASAGAGRGKIPDADKVQTGSLFEQRPSKARALHTGRSPCLHRDSAAAINGAGAGRSGRGRSRTAAGVAGLRLGTVSEELSATIPLWSGDLDATGGGRKTAQE